MTPDESRLLRHLVWAVALKLLVLVALWWGFVRDDRVGVDPERAADHLSRPAASPRPQGANP